MNFMHFIIFLVFLVFSASCSDPWIFFTKSNENETATAPTEISTSQLGTSEPKSTATSKKANKLDCPKVCQCIPESDPASYLDGFIVSCAKNGLEILPSPAEMPDKTVTIDLSGNQIKKVTVLDNALLGLLTLNLSRNKISQIEPKAFEMVPTLEALDLSFNKLDRIENMVFAKLNRLKRIDFSDNDISKIEANIFDDQQWLEVLILRGNSLKSLPETIFRNNQRLRRLDLSHNSMYSLPDAIFHDTPALSFIDLSENQFILVPSTQLLGLNKLEELDVSANQMSKLDHSSFAGILNLKILRINNCPRLIAIDDFTFAYMGALEELEIKNNPRFNSLSPSAFFTINHINLKRLDFYGNQLSRLTEHTLPICNISMVDLRDNQWRCDCHFRWVKSCKQDDPIHQQIRCTSPLKLSTIEISSIGVDQFTCPNEGNGIVREMKLFRLFVVLFGVLTLVFLGFLVTYYLHKAKVIRSFGHKYQRMGSIHYVKDQTNNDIVPE